MNGEVQKTYKGFNNDMTCRGFQYKEGEEYETDKAQVCECGFHACEHPLETFMHYPPSQSVFHEVEQSGEISKGKRGAKISSTKIKIGARMSIAEIVKAAIKYTMKNIKEKADLEEKRGASSATGNYGASSATGYCGASSATGYCGASSATGNYGASSATGYCGASSATGNYGASSATGVCSASLVTGYKSASIAENKESIAIAWGYKSKAKGALGSYLVFAEWDGNEAERRNPMAWTLKGAKMVQVDGETIKPDTWYVIKNGEVIEESSHDQ